MTTFVLQQSQIPRHHYLFDDELLFSPREEQFIPFSCSPRQISYSRRLSPLSTFHRYSPSYYVDEDEFLLEELRRQEYVAALKREQEKGKRIQALAMEKARREDIARRDYIAQQQKRKRVNSAMMSPEFRFLDFFDRPRPNSVFYEIPWGTTDSVDPFSKCDIYDHQSLSNNSTAKPIFPTDNNNKAENENNNDQNNIAGNTSQNVSRIKVASETSCTSDNPLNTCHSEDANQSRSENLPEETLSDLQGRCCSSKCNKRRRNGRQEGFHKKLQNHNIPTPQKSVALGKEASDLQSSSFDVTTDYSVQVADLCDVDEISDTSTPSTCESRTDDIQKTIDPKYPESSSVAEVAAQTLQSQYRRHLQSRVRKNFSKSLSTLSKVWQDLSNISTKIPSINPVYNKEGKFINGYQNKELLGMEEKLLKLLETCDTATTGGSILYILNSSRYSEDNHKDASLSTETSGNTSFGNDIDTDTESHTTNSSSWYLNAEDDSENWWDKVALHIRKERKRIVKEIQKSLSQIDDRKKLQVSIEASEQQSEKETNLNEINAEEPETDSEDGWSRLSKMDID